MSYNCGLLIYSGKIKLHVGLIRSKPHICYPATGDWL